MSTPTTLRSNTIVLLGAATLGMVFLTPAMTLDGLFGPIFLACGKLAPMSFVLALFATLPTAISYAVRPRVEDHRYFLGKTQTYPAVKPFPATP